MKIGVVVPSYFKEKGKWLSLVNRFYDSLIYIKDIDNLIFLCNWQNIPDEDPDIINLLHKFDGMTSINNTWMYRCVYKKYDVVSMCNIRNDCMLLDTTCDLYLFVDDDLYFRQGSSEDYKFVLNKFDEDAELGLVMCAGYLGGYNYKDKLRYDPYKHYMTNRGLFIKNLHKCAESPMYPASLLRYQLGGFEDAIVGFEITAAGYKCATKFNCSTQHPAAEGSGVIDRTISTESTIHNPDSSFSTLSRYLLEEFGYSVILNNIRDICSAKRDIFEKGI